MEGIFKRYLRRGRNLLDQGVHSSCDHEGSGMHDVCIDGTLATAMHGKTYLIVGLNCGCGLNERISAMGLNSGAHFTIVSNSGHGPVGVEVKGTRIGIGRGMAEKIRVKEVGPDS